MIDTEFVEEIFGNRTSFVNFVNEWRTRKLPMVKSEEGMIIGGEEFHSKAMENFDRRRAENPRKKVNQRKIYNYFEPVEKIFMEFKKKHGIAAIEIDTSTFEGKRLRSELLFHLKDRSGLKYSEIIKYPMFENLKHNSLPGIYKSAKQRLESKK